MNNRKSRLQQPILIIGIGNEYRSDDAVGLVIARALQARSLPYTRVIEASGEGTALLEAWKESDHVILVDAVTSQAPEGTIYCLDAQSGPFSPNLFTLSTHAFGVAEAIELGRALGDLPQQLVLYGIETKNFVAGVALSLKVERAAQAVIEDIARLVQNWLES